MNPETAAMLDTIERHLLQAAADTGVAALSPALRAAFEQTDRQRFAGLANSGQAYDDFALPIGCGQTISQPFIVALMTELLSVRPGDKVLEIGTGSGYQAAILAQLGARVYTIETVAALAAQCQDFFASHGMANVRCVHGNGAQGLPDCAPYDKLIVTAAAADLPPALLLQLRPGAIAVAPLGGPDAQQLTVLVHASDGSWLRRDILPVRFVPFTGLTADKD